MTYRLIIRLAARIKKYTVWLQTEL